MLKVVSRWNVKITEMNDMSQRCIKQFAIERRPKLIGPDATEDTYQNN